MQISDYFSSTPQLLYMIRIASFESVARSIAVHHPQILHYFDNRSTNASAESFNAKLKAFRSVFRGVRDTTFFLYRVMKLYA